MKVNGQDHIFIQELDLIFPGCPAQTDNNEISVPDPYLDDSDCAWQIALQPGESVLITVTMLEIEVDSTTDSNNTCYFDYLSINGVKYCGAWVPPAFDSGSLQL